MDHPRVILSIGIQITVLRTPDKMEQKEHKKMTDFYKLLEITNNASTEVIRAAYKVKVKQYHPDNYINPSEKEHATQTLQLLNKAVDILTDPEARNRYDAELAASHNFGTDSQNNFGQNARATPDEDEAILAAKVQTMIRNTYNEESYLTLHKQISSLSVSDRDKVFMSELLDEFTSVKLKNELAQAEELEYLEDEVKSTRNGIIAWLIIGFFVSAWFNYAFLIAVGLCILSYIGSKDDRLALQQARIAIKVIAVYRANGFRL